MQELFRYSAGDPVALLGGTFARADPTTCATYVDAAGIVQTVAANVLRDGHYLNGVRTTLLEGSRINSALGACSFADATYWGNIASYTVSAAPSCIAGQTAYRHLWIGANARSQPVGVFVNGQPDCLSVVLENDATLPSSTSRIGIRDTTVPAWVVLVEFTWATHLVAVTAGAGTCGVVNLGNGRYRVWVRGTGTAAGTGAAGNGRSAYIYPAYEANKAVVLHHAQFEADAAFPSSPIVTVAAAVTRAADVLSFPFAPVPQAMTAYTKHVEGGTLLGGPTRRLLAIGDPGTSKALYLQPSATPGNWRISHKNAVPTTVTSAAALAAALGDTVELRGILNADGSVQLGQALNGAAEALAAASAANALSADWNPTSIGIGGDTTGATGFAAIQRVRIAAGVQTLTDMQNLVGIGVVAPPIAHLSAIKAWEPPPPMPPVRSYSFPMPQPYVPRTLRVIRDRTGPTYRVENT